MYVFDRFSCSLLRQDMKQIIINLETPEIHSLEKTGEKEAIAKIENSQETDISGMILSEAFK